MTNSTVGYPSDSWASCSKACVHGLTDAAEDATGIDARQHWQPESTAQQQLETIDAGQLPTRANQHQLRQRRENY